VQNQSGNHSGSSLIFDSRRVSVQPQRPERTLEATADEIVEKCICSFSVTEDDREEHEWLFH